MIHEAPAVEARQDLGELLNETRHKRGSVIILQNGKRTVSIVEIAVDSLMKVELDTNAPGSGIPRSDSARMYLGCLPARRIQARPQ